jgi:hypothetical protein
MYNYIPIRNFDLPGVTRVNPEVKVKLCRKTHGTSNPPIRPDKPTKQLNLALLSVRTNMCSKYVEELFNILLSVRKCNLAPETRCTRFLDQSLALVAMATLVFHPVYEHAHGLLNRAAVTDENAFIRMVQPLHMSVQRRPQTT